MPYTITRRRRLRGIGQTSVSLFDQIMAYAQTLPAFGGAHGDVMSIGQFCPIYKAVTGNDCPSLTALAVFGINQTSAYPTAFLIQAVQSAGASGAPAPVPTLSPISSVAVPGTAMAERSLPVNPNLPYATPTSCPAGWSSQSLASGGVTCYPPAAPSESAPVPLPPTSTYTVSSGEAPAPSPSSAPGLIAPVTGYLQTAESAAMRSFSLPVWAIALGAAALFLFGRRGR